MSADLELAMPDYVAATFDCYDTFSNHQQDEHARPVSMSSLSALWLESNCRAAERQTRRFERLYCRLSEPTIERRVANSLQAVA
jgi:hypothetical protein